MEAVLATLQIGGVAGAFAGVMLKAGSTHGLPQRLQFSSA